MASINDRWWVKDSQGVKRRSNRYGTGLRWQVRYRDLQGKSRNKSFERRIDSERFMSSISVELHRGTYLDPRLGNMKFDELARQWIASRTSDASTIRQAELHIRLHVSPYFGSKSVSSILPSDIQAWLAIIQENCSPKYVRLIFQNFRAILSSAVEDGILIKNPAISSSVRLPKSPTRRIEVWTDEQVSAVVQAHPLHLRGIPLIGAMCGLRQGETFGLRIQDINFENQEITIRQQIKLINTKPTPSFPKSKKSRVVPMPDMLKHFLIDHLNRFEVLAGQRLFEPCVGGLLFAMRERKPLNKNYYNTAIWHPALIKADLPLMRSNGTHALRHYCASKWLEHGVSIRAVSEYLGHSDPGFTLRVYTHMMPKSDAIAKESFPGFDLKLHSVIS
jgi:integrase